MALVLRLAVVLLLALGCLAVYSAHPVSTFADDPRLYYTLSGRLLGQPVWTDAIQRKFDRAIAPPSLDLPAQDASPPRFVEHPRQTPYADFRCEYPPLALVLFAVPRLFTADVPTYYRIFAIMMSLTVAALGGLGYLFIRRLAPERPMPLYLATVLWSACVLCAGPLLVLRFDVFVILWVVLAVLALLAERPRWAGICLGVGIALKLWPIFLLPVLLASLIARRSWRPALAFCLSTMLVVLLAHAIFPRAGLQVLSYLGYHSARGLEIESSWGSVLALASRLSGSPASAVIEFGAPHLHTGYSLAPWVKASYVAMLATNLLIAALAYRGLRQVRQMPQAFRVRLAAAVLGTTLALIVSAKVLSAQYLFWLIPLAYVLPGRAGAALVVLLLASLATTLYCFPAHFRDMLALDPTIMTVLVARNLLLALMAILAGWIATHARPAITPPPAADPIPAAASQ